MVGARIPWIGTPSALQDHLDANTADLQRSINNVVIGETAQANLVVEGEQCLSSTLLVADALRSGERIETECNKGGDSADLELSPSVHFLLEWFRL